MALFCLDICQAPSWNARSAYVQICIEAITNPQRRHWLDRILISVIHSALTSVFTRDVLYDFMYAWFPLQTE